MNTIDRSYVIISPVRDEERYIEKTLQTVLRQTLRPSKWIIVNDGSRDKTAEIINRYTRDHQWISAINTTRTGSRDLGNTEIRAFAEGYRLVENLPHRYIVKLDGDVELPDEYFSDLVRQFESDPRLGIASGMYVELKGGCWSPVEMPEYHASGASKMIRTDCFHQIGGFALGRGWDTLDEIKAQMSGWTTRHFKEIVFRHLKNEGSADGPLRTSRMHGLIYYLTGGGIGFLSLKILHRCIYGRPFLLAGCEMGVGYLKPYLSGEGRIVTDSEARWYRGKLNQRLRQNLLQIITGKGGTA